MINVRDKGKRFELEVSKLIASKFGIACSRTPNSGGLDIKGDIMSLSGIASRFNWECKNQEHLSIYKALSQSEADAGYKIPVVVFKRNNSETYATLILEDFLNLLKEIEELQEEKKCST